ncbi:hypothetical protein ACHFCA_17220 [Delftia tsuruhatensis]
MSETALTLKQAAERLQVSYGTVFERRHEIAFRLRIAHMAHLAICPCGPQ